MWPTLHINIYAVKHNIYANNNIYIIINIYAINRINRITIIILHEYNNNPISSSIVYMPMIAYIIMVTGEKPPDKSPPVKS